MQNEHPFGGQPPFEAPKGQSGPSESQEWSAFERELEILGRQLSQLRSHEAVLGDHLVQGLEAQYHEVKTRAEAWKRATERQVNEAQGAYNDLRARSKEAARQMWERGTLSRAGMGNGQGRSSKGKGASLPVLPEALGN